MDIRTLSGAGSPITVMFSLRGKARAANGQGLISGGGANILCPLSSLFFASDIYFFNLASDSLSNVPLSSRCLASEIDFLGDTVSSSPNEM